MTVESASRAKQIIGLLDLTSLNADDTEDDVIALCRRAQTAYGSVAAVCVWPRFASVARRTLADSGIGVAAVTNFPGGGDNADLAARETAAAIDQGADEIDTVFPYHAWLLGNRAAGRRLVEACKAVCESAATLKVILETGQLVRPEEITAAAHCALDAGADFIKTSTGKTPVSATLESAGLMLQAIKAHGGGSFKAAGGIRDLAAAEAYLDLADDILGRGWASAQTFRFGASGLLQALLNELGEREQIGASDY